MLGEKFRRHLRDAQVRLLVAVHRVHGHVLDHGTHGVQAEQHVGLKEVAALQFVQRQFPQHPGVDGGVAIGRVHHRPVATAELGDEGQGGVAQQPYAGHVLQRVGAEEAVALGVVGAALADGGHEAGDEARVHLAVAVDLHHHVDAVGQCGLVGGEDGAAHAPVFGVVEHAHAGVLVVLLDEAAAALGAGVVHRIDDRHLGADGRNHAQYVLGDLVAGDGNGDAHGSLGGLRWCGRPRRCPPGSGRLRAGCAGAGAPPGTTIPGRERSGRPGP